MQSDSDIHTHTHTHTHIYIYIMFLVEYKLTQIIWRVIGIYKFYIAK